METFRLVTLDLDYTIFLGNSVLFLNKILKISVKLDEYHESYRGGKISEKELNELQSRILEKISYSEAFEVLSKGPILNNLERGTKILQNRGCNVEMLTLNPFQLFFKRFGIGTNLSPYATTGDHFTLARELPENKAEILKEYCAEKKIELMKCAHVGDAQNDVQTFREVGFSVALNSSDPRVQREASISMKTRDFQDIAFTILRANDLA